MRRRAVTLLLVVCIVMSVANAVFAREVVPYASSYLDRYGVSLIAAGDGQMAIDMSVDGVSKMSKIGVLEVYIEEKNTSTSSWHEYDTLYGMDDPDTFYDYNSYDYLRTNYFDGVVGRYYRVTITAHAVNSSGSDHGDVTSYTVRCK